MPNTEDSEKGRYHSFLLRLWQAADEEMPEWRFSLEDPETGKRVGFTQIGELVDFLLKTICAQEN